MLSRCRDFSLNRRIGDAGEISSFPGSIVRNSWHLKAYWMETLKEGRILVQKVDGMLNVEASAVGMTSIMVGLDGKGKNAMKVEEDQVEFGCTWAEEGSSQRSFLRADHCSFEPAMVAIRAASTNDRP